MKQSRHNFFEFGSQINVGITILKCINKQGNWKEKVAKANATLSLNQLIIAADYQPSITSSHSYASVLILV